MNATEAVANSIGQLRRRAAGHAGNGWEVIRRCSPWILLIPLLPALSTISRVYVWVWPYDSAVGFQQTGTAILGIAFVSAVTFWVLRGELFHRWLIFVIFCLLCQSLQLVGTRSVVAVALMILIWQASVNFAQLRPYLGNRLLASLLVGGAACHVLPVLTPYPLWMVFAKFDIWERRISAVLLLVSQTTLLAAVVSSEILFRCGKLTSEPAVTLPFEATPAADSIPEEPERKAA